MKSLREKIARGILYAGLASLAYAGYMYLGTKHRLDVESEQAAGLCEGHNNHPIFSEDVLSRFEPGFYTEFFQEKDALEQRVLESSTTGCTNITVNLFIDPEVKYFFDDATNPNDNDEWTRRVEMALDGLHIYERMGFGFKFMNVSGTVAPNYEFENGTVMQPEDFNVNFSILFTAVDENPKSLGRAECPGNNAIIGLTNNDKINEYVFAHEMGHLFGIEHTEENTVLDEYIDPFCLFSRDIMVTGYNFSYCDYCLTNDEIEIIQNARARFVDSAYGSTGIPPWLKL